MAELQSWDIEIEARLYSSSIPWDDRVLDYDLYEERLVCGDESSVVARFQQNLGHALSPVLREYVRAGLQFGDFKCAAPERRKMKGGTPDMVLIDDKHVLYSVGESKAPWVHDIDKAQKDKATFRNYIG